MILSLDKIRPGTPTSWQPVYCPRPDGGKAASHKHLQSAQSGQDHDIQCYYRLHGSRSRRRYLNNIVTFSRNVWLLLGLLLGSTTSHASIALFYAPNPPINELTQFRHVVLQASTVARADTTFLRDNGSLSYAYLSLGEYLPTTPDDRAPAPTLVENTDWGSLVVDLRSTEWHRYILDKAIPERIAKGFDGLFLDTLDSYQLLDEGIAQQQAGLASLIRAIAQRYPDLKLLFNRGFEILPELSSLADGVLAESLFYGWNAREQRYQKMAEADSAWLQAQLTQLQQQGLPIFVLDYLPPEQRELARQLARRIAALGFTPWISGPELDYLGVGSIEVLPRRVLVLHDGGDTPLAYSQAHQLLGNLLDYLGLRADYHDIRKPPPATPLAGLYRGVVHWTGRSRYSGELQAYETWSMAQIQAGVPTLFLGTVPIQQAQHLQALGLVRAAGELAQPLTIVQQAPTIGRFEAPAKPRARNVDSIQSDNAEHSWLRLQDTRGTLVDTVVIKPWGGYAQLNYLLTPERLNYQEWITDPLALLTSALSLPALPIVDSTTENGSRIITNHIDGDAFPSRAEFAPDLFSAEVIQREILEPFHYPFTVSVIEGEIGAGGLYPELSPELENIARSLFRLNNVEVASHSFSHPFYWNRAHAPQAAETLYGLHLPIPGYDVKLEREIIGSIDYINRRLAPPHKPVKVMLWTGDALPGAEAIALSQRAGVTNLNGGNTRVTRERPSITGIYPAYRHTNQGLHYYAPVGNENIYTNNWQGPFYGFRDVIDTFKLTDQPRRFKPISMYWHFYSGTKLASLNALKQVYRWLDTQDGTALYISEFTQRVRGLHTASFSRQPDGRIQVRGLHGLRTLRLPKSLGWPDLDRSEHIAGVIDLPQGRYLHLSADNALLALHDKPPQSLYLKQANAPLTQWQARDDGSFTVSFSGHQPLKLWLHSSQACTLEDGERRYQSQTQNADTQLLTLKTATVTHARLNCR